MLGAARQDPRRPPDGRAAGRLTARVRRPRRRPAPARSTSTMPRPRCGCCWAGRSAPARPTWTGCGRARTCRRSCGSPPSTARRWPCPRAGGGCRCGSRTRSPTGPAATPSPGAAATSRPTTTWATTSTACSSTRRWPTRAPSSPRPTSRSQDAQRDKFRVIAERAGLRGGEHVLEIGSGWGGFALYAAGELGLPRHDDHRLAGPAAAGGGAGRRGRARRPRQRRAARLPRDLGHLRRDRVDRDARGRGRGLLHDVLRGLRQGPGARGPDEPPGDHVPGRRLRAAAPGRQLDPDLHLPGRPPALPRRDRALPARHEPAGPARRGHRPELRPDAPGLAGRLPRAAATRSGRWASTSASSGCGTTTSRSARPASRPA